MAIYGDAIKTIGGDSFITLSGSLVRFTSSKSKPFVSTVASIVPQQDLHGQSSPYPSGGGKNKFVPNFDTETQNGITFTNNNGVINANGTLSTPLDFVCGHVTLSAGSYILNGCPSDGGSSTYRLQVTDYPVVNSLGQDSGSGVSFTLANDMEVAIRIQVRSSLSNVVFKPMICLSSVTDATFAPYSNICPISGWDAVKVWVQPTHDTSANPTITIPLGDTVYGGTLTINEDGSGDLTVDRANIASYNGEQLPSTWISDRDVYSAGTTPTIGAQVVYELATPTTTTLTAQQINTLVGENNVWADSGDIEVTVYGSRIP